jgi:hypothetical protein
LHTVRIDVPNIPVREPTPWQHPECWTKKHVDYNSAPTVMSSAPYWDSGSPQDWAFATARDAVLRPLVEASAASEAAAKEAAQTLGIVGSRAQVSPLPPSRKPGRARLTHCLSDTLERLIAAAIDAVYVQRERSRLADLMRALIARGDAPGLAAPDRRTVKHFRRCPSARLGYVLIAFVVLVMSSGARVVKAQESRTYASGAIMFSAQGAAAPRDAPDTPTPGVGDMP